MNWDGRMWDFTRTNFMKFFEPSNLFRHRASAGASFTASDRLPRQQTSALKSGSDRKYQYW
eukprot:2348063-Rhodomonas_salina.2